jgi:hypothetical protein
LIENPPWLRPSASPIPSTVPSPPDGAGPTRTGGVLVGAHHRGVHEVQVPVEGAAGIGLCLQAPQYLVEHAGLPPAVEPARHGPDRTIAGWQIRPRRTRAQDPELQQALLVEADRLVGGSDAILVVGDTALPKKGNRSVGVAPQYATTLGKTANCQTLVSLTLARG